MEQETPRPMPLDDVDRAQYLEQSFDLVARVRAAREVAQREIEAFGDVSEYEIRKIYGQRTDIRYDDAVMKEKAPAETPRADRDAAADSRFVPEATEDRRQSTFDFNSEVEQPRPEE